MSSSSSSSMPAFDDFAIKAQAKVTAKLSNIKTQSAQSEKIVLQALELNKLILLQVDILANQIQELNLSKKKLNKIFYPSLKQMLLASEKSLDLSLQNVHALSDEIKKIKKLDYKVFEDCITIMAATITHYKTIVINIREQAENSKTKLKNLMLNELRNASDPTNDGRGREMGLGREPMLLPNQYHKKGVLRTALYQRNERYTETEETKHSSSSSSNEIIKKGDTRIGKLKEVDDRRALDGRGIALAPKHQLEKNDPHHRGWRTLFNIELGERLDNWKKLDATQSRNLFQWADQNKVSHREGKIVYMTPEESSQFIVTANKNGHLTYANRSKAGTPLPDSNDREEQYIYVMDLSGNFFIAKEGDNQERFKERGRLQHPSFTAGDRVLCAGKLTILGGKITYIDNDSGHYLGGGYSLSRLADELEKRNLFAKTVQFYVKADDRFEKLLSRNKPTLSLTEFRDVLRVWPSSPLAKLDLSEKKSLQKSLKR